MLVDIKVSYIVINAIQGNVARLKGKVEVIPTEFDTPPTPTFPPYR